MKRLFIDPSYPAYEKNKLFDKDDIVLNRDDSLAPYIKLKSDLEKLSIEALTYDCVKNFSNSELDGDGYISFGMMRDFEEIKKNGLRLVAFFILEPPLIINKTYLSLPYLTSMFEKVFIHNTTGDCFDLSNVKVEKLSKLYWPQPYPEVNESYWGNTDRMNKIVVINGHHRPRRLLQRELYSQRIKWFTSLNKYIPVDLYGRGWDQLISRSSLWPTYLKNYFSIKRIYKGTCSSKLKLMSQYDFALCFENLIMDSYITEKIFDCFYSGVIPIYRGGDDIQKWIPSEAFIDLRKFANEKDLSDYLINLTMIQKKIFRDAGKAFVSSHEGQKYYNLISSLEPLL